MGSPLVFAFVVVVVVLGLAPGIGCRTRPYESVDPVVAGCLGHTALVEVQQESTGAGVPGMVLADFNDDRRADVFLTLPRPRGWLGGADGRLVAQPPVDVAGYLPLSGDFNADHRADVVLSFSPTEQPLQGSVALGDGAGGFHPIVPFENSMYVGRALGVGDVNGDGRSDLLISDRGDVRTLLSSPTGQLRPAGRDAPGFVPRVVVDFNGDRRADVAGPDDNQHLGVAFGVGAGTFDRIARYPEDQPLASLIQTVVATADLDGNGRPDVLAIHVGDGISVWLTDSRGQLTRARGVPDSSLARSSDPDAPGFLATGDFNGDGRLDLAAATFSPRYALGLACGHRDGSFDALAPYVDTSPGSAHAGQRVVAVGAGDVDGDGRDDLIVLFLVTPLPSPTGMMSVFLSRPN